MGYLNLSNFITLFSQQTSNNVVQSSNTITSPVIINKRLNVTHEKKADELEDDDILIPITSTPKDTTVKKIQDKQCRERRHKRLNHTHAKEIGKLEIDNDNHISVDNTSKDVFIKKSEDKLYRERRSPSFWEDSIHTNYRNKYKDIRYKESIRWQNKNYRDRYDTKYW